MKHVLAAQLTNHDLTGERLDLEHAHAAIRVGTVVHKTVRYLTMAWFADDTLAVLAFCEIQRNSLATDALQVVEHEEHSL